MTAPALQVRPWSPADETLINKWRLGHGVPPMPSVLVPPTNVVLEADGEPVAFAACYTCPAREDGGGNVGLIEWLVTKPGLTLARANEYIGHVIECLRMGFIKNGGGMLVVYVGRAGSRVAEANGFTTTEAPLFYNYQLLEGDV